MKGFALKVTIMRFSVQTLCLCGLMNSEQQHTTETQRTQRLHREFRTRTYSAKPHDRYTSPAWMKRRFSRHLARALVLMALGSALVIVAPASRVTTVPATPPAASPTPTPDAGEKKPNPVRRFFSWVGRTVTRPFRRRVQVISDPPIVDVSASKSLITF